MANKLPWNMTEKERATYRHARKRRLMWERIRMKAALDVYARRLEALAALAPETALHIRETFAEVEATLHPTNTVPGLDA